MIGASLSKAYLSVWNIQAISINKELRVNAYLGLLYVEIMVLCILMIEL